MKILIADDHGLFREGLRLVLQQLDSNLQVVEASDFHQAVAAATSGENLDLSLVLLDLSMPGMPWQEALAALRANTPDLPVVILSATDDRPLVMQAVKLGASGFIPKSSNSRVMLGALQLVLSGGVYLPPALVEQSPSGQSHHSRGEAMADGTEGAILTPRQREVLALVGEGKSNKEVARLLELSEGTVKLHVTAILKALNVNNRTRAVVAASQLGLTPLPKVGAYKMSPEDV
ncbi:MAG: response regulator transcription factor [Alphaproteobacteria bacterium]